MILRGYRLEMIGAWITDYVYGFDPKTYNLTPKTFLI